jgi:hypothetical protein
MRWLITDRNLESPDGFGTNLAQLTYWTADPRANHDLTKRSAWTRVTPKQFQDALAIAASTFPLPWIPQPPAKSISASLSMVTTIRLPRVRIAIRRSRPPSSTARTGRSERVLR